MQSTCTYHSILSKAQELKNHIDNENSQDKVKGMVKLMKKQSQLFSLSEVFTNLKDINPFIDSILDPATTGYTSDAYEVSFLRANKPRMMKKAMLGLPH
jgi:hypothetical protein